ncbi:uncharacterized protein YALI1_F26780g [Yarrowia lipolytica]|uniref:Uncharacterized protein n=1 Tax=Yarrowia lipolytica TaxID=4952 RepID=A0A1D8NP94_YARLL|nr:hypothetical protein YALI1_F26780g [Yarrowia lipolytica]
MISRHTQAEIRCQTWSGLRVSTLYSYFHCGYLWYSSWRENFVFTCQKTPMKVSSLNATIDPSVLGGCCRPTAHKYLYVCSNLRW